MFRAGCHPAQIPYDSSLCNNDGIYQYVSFIRIGGLMIDYPALNAIPALLNEHPVK